MERIAEISQDFRVPFYFIRINLKQITGAFIFLPSLVFDLVKDDLDNDRTENLIKIFGKNWKKYLYPDLNLWAQKYPNKGPTEVATDDDDLYEPMWPKDKTRRVFMGKGIWLVGLGILKIDNLMQLRKKIMATLGYNVFSISLSFLKQAVMTTNENDEFSEIVETVPVDEEPEIGSGLFEKALSQSGGGGCSDALFYYEDGRVSSAHVVDCNILEDAFVADEIPIKPKIAGATKKRYISQEVIDFIEHDLGKTYTAVVTDIIVSGSDKINTVLNPFNRQTYATNLSHINENLALTPESFVYVMYLGDYVNDNFGERQPNYLRDIYPIYPQTTEGISQYMLKNYKYQHLTNLFLFEPASELDIQLRLENVLQSGVLMNKLPLEKPIAEIIKIFTFRFKLKTKYGGLDILKTFNELAYQRNSINYVECRIYENLREKTLVIGTPLDKSIDIVGDTKPKHLNGLQYLFFEYEAGSLRCHCFIDEFGNAKIKSKLDKVEHDFNSAIQIVERSFDERFHGEAISSSNFGKENISSMSVKFLYEQMFYPKHFDKTKKLIIDMQHLHLFEVAGTTNDSISIKLPYAMLNEKGSIEHNAFSKWNEIPVKKVHASFVNYRFITINILYKYTRIEFNCQVVPQQHRGLVSSIVQYICQQIEGSDLLETPIDYENAGDNKIKLLRHIDRKRFDNVRTTGKISKSKDFGYSQRCQRTDQHKVIRRSRWKELVESGSERAIRMVNKTSGGYFYLECPEDKEHTVFMPYADANTKIVNGVEVFICIPCCRKRKTKSGKRKEINKECLRTGTYPVDSFVDNVSKTRILNFTKGYFENRVVRPNKALGIPAGNWIKIFPVQATQGQLSRASVIDFFKSTV